MCRDCSHVGITICDECLRWGLTEIYSWTWMQPNIRNYLYPPGSKNKVRGSQITSVMLNG